MSHLQNVQTLQNKLLLLNLLTTSQLSKTLSAFASQLEPQNVVRFFKCMDSSCDFCTDEQGLFLDHLSTHSDPIVQCAYCNNAIGEADLVWHMVATHGSSSLQCALCFYRAHTVTHMRVHGLVVHKSKASFWYACKVRLPDEPRLMCAGKSHIQCYACTGGCKFKTLCMERFLKHLLRDHAGHQALLCHICSVIIDMPGALISHYLQVHGLYAVHCLYCPFGSQNDWDVVVHVARCHPDNPFKIFCRSEKMPQSFRVLKGLGREKLSEGIPATAATSVVSQCPKIECREELQETKVVLHPKVKLEPVENHPSAQVEAIGSSLPSQGFDISETECKCGLVFYDVAVLMQHMTESHSQEPSLSCPKCPLLRGGSVGDFFAHLVDKHTAWFRCYYKGCIFLSGSQQGVDDHVIQVHQHFDFPEEEDAWPAEKEETCSVAGDVGYPESNTAMHKAGNGETTEQPASDSEDKQLSNDRLKYYTCSLCCQSDMEALDYFRHMSLGHGVKFFCGYCEKGYKNRKQMMLHHSRCHADLQFSVKSFERNTLRDVASLVQSDWENEFEYEAKEKLLECNAKEKSSDEAVASLTETADYRLSEVTEIPVIAVKSRVSHFASLPSSSLKTSNPGMAPRLLPMGPVQVTSESVSSRKKALLDSMNILEAIPLGKKPVTFDKQKVRYANSNSATARQETVLDKTRQISKARSNNVVSTSSYPCDMSKTVVLHTKDSAPSCANVCHPEKPATEGTAAACQPTSKGKVLFHCGHCSKGYKLFKCLVKHQKSVHPTLPQAVRRVDLAKQDDVTDDDGAKERKSPDAGIDVDPGPSTTTESKLYETSSEDEDFAGSKPCRSEDRNGATPKNKWRRIRLMISDSEDEESNRSEIDDQQEGFSYYGKEVEDVDYENTYVRFSAGDFRMAYCQLAGIANLLPIVLVRKEKLLP